MGLGIGSGHANFASFPAIGTVVFAVHAQAYALLPLAVAAIAITLTICLRQVALRTENGALHILASRLRRAGTTPQPQSPLENTIGQPSAPEQAASVCRAIPSSRARAVNRLRDIPLVPFRRASFQLDVRSTGNRADSGRGAHKRAWIVIATGTAACNRAVARQLQGDRGLTIPSSAGFGAPGLFR
jgi:hypothetical protein